MLNVEATFIICLHNLNVISKYQKNVKVKFQCMRQILPENAVNDHDIKIL